jgi:hypothetical protein
MAADEVERSRIGAGPRQQGVPEQCSQGPAAVFGLPALQHVADAALGHNAPSASRRPSRVASVVTSVIVIS